MTGEPLNPALVQIDKVPAGTELIIRRTGEHTAEAMWSDTRIRLHGPWREVPYVDGVITIEWAALQ